MKTKAIKVQKKTVYNDIEYHVSSFEGIPIMETITAEEQKSFVDGGYGTVAELIDMNINNYRDWQSDC